MKNGNSFLTIFKWGVLLGVIISGIEIVKNFAHKLDLSAYSSVISICLILLIILILYAGIKEVRDRHEAQLISYPKAFGIGIGITLIAFLIVLFSLTVIFSVQPQFLQNINQKNQQLYHEKLQKDSITTAEITHFLKQVDSLTLAKEQEIVSEMGYSDATAKIIDSNITLIKNHFGPYIQHGRAVDSVQYQLGNFDTFAKNAWVQFYERSEKGGYLTDSLITPITRIVITTAEEMGSLSVLENRYLNTKEGNVFIHSNPLSSAMMFALSLIIYGLLCDLFVALYLYRKKEAIPASSEEEEEDPSNETSTEQNENESVTKD